MGCQDNPASQVLQDCQVLEKVVGKDYLDSQGGGENLVTRVCQDFLDFPVQKETEESVSRDCQELKVHQDHLGDQDQVAYLA